METKTMQSSATGVEHDGAPNGKAQDHTDQTNPDAAREEAMRRAEELVDRFGEQVGRGVTYLGHTILKWAARAREEAEDIWAEAKAMKEKQQATSSQSKDTSRANGP